MTGTDGLGVKLGGVALCTPGVWRFGYTAGCPLDYNRAHALDVAQVFAFLRATQPNAFKKLAMADELFSACDTSPWAWERASLPIAAAAIRRSPSTLAWQDD